MTEHQKDVWAGIGFAAFVVVVLVGGWLVLRLALH